MENSIQDRVQDILTTNDLDFRIEKLKLGAELPVQLVDAQGDLINGTKKIASPFYGLYNTKTGKIINSVKEGYTVSQNAEIVELVLKGMEKFGELSVHKAGSLNGGKKIFIQLGIEGYSKVGDDRVKRYVTIIDSNDGSSSLSVGIGDFTMSCSNQFFYFSKKGQSKMRHTASLEQKMREIPFLIEMALGQSMEMLELYKKFSSVGITDNNIHGMVKLQVGLSRLSSTLDVAEASSRVENAMNKLYDQIAIEVAQKGKNIWGLHSGVTRWTTHEKSAPTRTNGRIESAMTSTNYRSNQESLEFAKELALI